VFLCFLFVITLNSFLLIPGLGVPASQETILSTNSLNADIKPPNLVVTQPENFSSISGWFTISVEATDNESIDSVVYRELSQSEYTPMIQNISDSTNYRAQVDSRRFTNGVSFIEIVANDSSNNYNRTLLMLGVFNFEAEADIYVYNVTGLTGECPCLDDFNVSIFWDKVEPFPIEEFNGYIKFSHNFTHIFGLFAYDSSFDWISIQFDNDGDGECMEDGEDIWWFRENEEKADYTAVKQPTFQSPKEDTQDLIFESGTLANNSNLKFFEVIREFATTDNEDIKFQFGIPIGMIFASSNSDYHKKGTRTNFTLALRSIPPGDVTGTLLLNNSVSFKNNFNDLLLYGSLGLVLNGSLLVGLVAYNKSRKSK
jgi:hypothetical protein